MAESSTKAQLVLEHSFDDFLSGAVAEPVRDDFLIRIHVSRNTLVAIVLSLLLHALILLFAPTIKFEEPPAKPATAMQVNLLPSIPSGTPEVIVQTTELPKKPLPRLEKPKTSPPKVIVKTPAPKVITSEKPAFTVPEKLVKPSEAKPPQLTVPEKEIRPEDYPDMQSYMLAVRAQKQGGLAETTRQNAELMARERALNDEQIRDERIKRNLKVGTNGIFEITSLSMRSATFSFRGWTNDYSNANLQYFEVQAHIGEDVRLVMIRRMITLIRSHYDGDFQWESHRLGRSVTQSARLEDNAGLEDFLMMEFFGSRYKNAP
ncbi:MAG: hypothetical protein CVU29_09110 [Betaproteobacteria bacterium HGW-Betaproteobacteria-22]|nr:MAG: hypothetical protein CVU29_09110 [Betaproteobacteria bacterium HGW-Betaproteobacteria-22]